MTKKIFYAFSLIIFALSACKEEPIIIPPLNGNGGNTGSDVAKVVLVEEYTGAGCVNCPDGAAILNDLKSGTYKENLILVSIHAGFFTKKAQLPKEALLDLTTPKGNELQLYLGAPIGYPAAVIDRKVRDAGTGSLVAESKDQWASIIQTESKEKATAKLTLSKTYDAASRNLNINLKINPTETLTGDYAVTIMITENNIVDAQKTPEGVKVDYVHRHVLRDILTAAQGNAITESLSKDANVSRSFSYQLPANWKSADCEIVAVLHKVGASKEVIQAAEISVE